MSPLFSSGTTFTEVTNCSLVGFVFPHRKKSMPTTLNLAKSHVEAAGRRELNTIVQKDEPNKKLPFKYF